MKNRIQLLQWALVAFILIACYATYRYSKAVREIEIRDQYIKTHAL